MINKIKNIFPEFKESRFYNKEHENLPNIFVGDFGDFAVDEIEKGNTSEVEKIINFINSTYEDLDDEGKNLIWIGVFEVVAGNKKWHSVLLKNLKESVKTEYFRRFEKQEVSGIFD